MLSPAAVPTGGKSGGGKKNRRPRKKTKRERRPGRRDMTRCALASGPPFPCRCNLLPRFALSVLIRPEGGPNRRFSRSLKSRAHDAYPPASHDCADHDGRRSGLPVSFVQTQTNLRLAGPGGDNLPTLPHLGWPWSHRAQDSASCVRQVQQIGCHDSLLGNRGGAKPASLKLVSAAGRASCRHRHRRFHRFNLFPQQLRLEVTAAFHPLIVWFRPPPPAPSSKL
jgi:hypothetical protein